MRKRLTVATRPGALAMAQTQIVVSALKQTCPGLGLDIEEIASKGDKDRRTTLWELKSTGFFTSKLEETLLARRADLAVHSFKDLPTALSDGLTVAAVLDRRFPEDCLVAAGRIKSLTQLRYGAKVGTSSLRRAVQLNRRRDDLQCLPIRGNVTTRLKKLDSGEFDAIILARAGLERLGLAGRISIIFDAAQFIPAPAQGALAVQTRADDAETIALVAAIDDNNARLTASAERKVYTVLECGCHAPAGAFAKIAGDQIAVAAFISDPSGENFAQAGLTGSLAGADKLAETLARQLLLKRR